MNKAGKHIRSHFERTSQWEKQKVKQVTQKGNTLKQTECDYNWFKVKW